MSLDILHINAVAAEHDIDNRPVSELDPLVVRKLTGCDDPEQGRRRLAENAKLRATVTTLGRPPHGRSVR